MAAESTTQFHDWRPPQDEDWRRLRGLLKMAMFRCRLPGDAWDDAQRDVRAIGDPHDFCDDPLNPPGSPLVASRRAPRKQRRFRQIFRPR
jgi:hypothetical protein